MVCVSYKNVSENICFSKITNVSKKIMMSKEATYFDKSNHLRRIKHGNCLNCPKHACHAASTRIASTGCGEGSHNTHSSIHDNRNDYTTQSTTYLCISEANAKALEHLKAKRNYREFINQIANIIW
ncbi:hypothetical protein GJ496_006001 [Pomphorhynchus laevis]|nr:hypothetical protein GJ496_006001 [Pomphorhynchus laevis]